MKKVWFLSIVALACAASSAFAVAPTVILNEWNCVKDTEHLDGGADPAFGNGTTGVNGNGGNWIELATTASVNMENWVLHWTNSDGTGNTEGFITLSDNSVWTSVPANTIITFLEINTGLTQGPTGDTGRYRTSYPNADSTFSKSYNWIHCVISDETYCEHGPAGFKVDNDNWQMEILDSSSNVIQHFVGEASAHLANKAFSQNWGLGAINKQEVGKLQANPSTVIDQDLSNYDDGDNSTFGAPNTWGSGSQTNF